MQKCLQTPEDRVLWTLVCYDGVLDFTQLSKILHLSQRKLRIILRSLARQGRIRRYVKQPASNGKRKEIVRLMI